MALPPPSPDRYATPPDPDLVERTDEWPEALERRAAERRRSHVDVQVEGDRSQADAQVVNHGPGGFFVECAQGFPPGQTVTVVCRGKRRAAEVVHQRAVPRSLVGMRNPGMGLRLVD